MSTPTYPLKSGRKLWSYQFVSQGPKGFVPKLIQFTSIGPDGVFNLAFGNEDLPTGEIDDMAVSNNGDIAMVLATVVEAIRDFVNIHPRAIIYFSGSTHSRTRLYRMVISKYLTELTADFDILGLREEDWFDFETEKN